MADEIGLAVVYRWQIHADREEEFREAWETLTVALRDRRGALGSRLHRAEDGTWVAYAQWPDRAAWQNSRDLDSVDPAASAALLATIIRSEEPLLLEPVRDYLMPGNQTR